MGSAKVLAKTQRGVGGAIIMAIVGLIKNAMAKK